MMHIETLKHRSSFVRLYSGKVFFGRYMTVQHCRVYSFCGYGYCRVGYTVGRKVGNSCRRNFARRRLRCMFKDVMSLRFADLAERDVILDYVLIARPILPKSCYKDMVREFSKSLSFFSSTNV